MWQSLSEPGLLPYAHTLLLWGTSVSRFTHTQTHTHVHTQTHARGNTHMHPTHIVKVQTSNYIKPVSLLGSVSDAQCPGLMRNPHTPCVKKKKSQVWNNLSKTRINDSMRYSNCKTYHFRVSVSLYHTFMARIYSAASSVIVFTATWLD